MLGRTEALRDVGGFDEGFFLYYEETDLCYRLQDAGWGVTYFPDAAFFHIGGEYDANASLALENQRSKLRYFLKHEGRARMLLASAITVARLTIRSALWLLRVMTAPDKGWQGRLTAGVRTLARYPGLVARFLFAPVPGTVGTSHEASS
jgi:GT2 family glycosyltransferase